MDASVTLGHPPSVRNENTNTKVATLKPQKRTKIAISEYPLGNFSHDGRDISLDASLRS